MIQHARLFTATGVRSARCFNTRESLIRANGYLRFSKHVPFHVTVTIINPIITQNQLQCLQQPIYFGCGNNVQGVLSGLWNFSVLKHWRLSFRETKFLRTSVLQIHSNLEPNNCIYLLVIWLKGSLQNIVGQQFCKQISSVFKQSANNISLYFF